MDISPNTSSRILKKPNQRREREREIDSERDRQTGWNQPWLPRSSRANMPQVEMILLFLTLIFAMCVYGQDPASKVVTDRYAVYWNRTNPK